MEDEVTGAQIVDSNIGIVGISSPSGGGKTTVAKRVAQLLPGAITVFFDDYDFDTLHPVNIRSWLEEGANYNDWKPTKLQDDLKKLKAGQAILKTGDGLAIKPKNYVIFDYALGYANRGLAKYIDFMVFIDTPPDVAMARRLLRDLPSISPNAPNGAWAGTLEHVKTELRVYLDYGRRAYLELDRQIKPNCDLVLDGCLSVDDLANQIVENIRAKTVC